MNHPRLSPLPLFLLSILSLIKSVYADTSGQPLEVTQLPHQVGQALGIPDFAAGILCFIVMAFMFTLPALIWGKKGSFVMIFIGMGVLGFSVAVNWIPFWFLLIIVLLLATMFAQDVRDMITGGT